jgi:hypothetical protein
MSMMMMMMMMIVVVLGAVAVMVVMVMVNIPDIRDLVALDSRQYGFFCVSVIIIL